MTSPNAYQWADREERFDALMRCAMRKRVGRAVPPPDADRRVLQRIQAVQRLDVVGRVWKQLGPLFETLVVYVLPGDWLVPARHAAPVASGARRLVRYDTHWRWLNQYQVAHLVA